MPKTERICPFEQEWVLATKDISTKHLQALIVLYALGWEPVYRTKLGTYRTVGRTLAYEIIAAEGYYYNLLGQVWILGDK